MKKNQLKELLSKEQSDLEKVIDKKKKELLIVKNEIKVGKEKNKKKVKNIKKEISQIKTILREKVLLDEIDKQLKEKESENDKKEVKEIKEDKKTSDKKK